MQTPIRLGLIGCGGIVQLQHLPTLCELDTVRIVALADPADDNLAKVGATTGVPPAQRYADYRDMLAQAALDAVLIATPHHLHAEQVIAAAEAGYTVISEKPMATSLEEAAAVLDAVVRTTTLFIQSSTTPSSPLVLSTPLRSCKGTSCPNRKSVAPNRSSP